MRILLVRSLVVTAAMSLTAAWGSVASAASATSPSPNVKDPIVKTPPPPTPQKTSYEQKGGKGPPPPREDEYSYIMDFTENALFRPVARVADMPRWIRKTTGNPSEAANVDADDQVRLPSTWWQPRIGFREVTVEQMLNGPGPPGGPASGKWTVTKAKGQGVSAGFQIKDSRGGKYIIKLDPPQFPECATGADVIGSYLFWAAGYNVPSNTIVYFRPESLVIGKDATFRDKWGRNRSITPPYMTTLLSKVAKQRDGRYRCVASEFLKGKPLGPFKYNGHRRDDPEDLIAHERRRELRGLWTVAAWLNHADVRGPNSLDMWVTENGRSFVRHNLLDFGSTLGSSATPTLRSYASGFEYYLDYKTIGRELVTAGLTPFKWEGVVDPKIPAVGFIESEHFDPVNWRPDNTNPAFDDRTARDCRWGARIVAGFTDDHIRAAVLAARFTDPRATEYLTRILSERRDKLVRHWLGTVYRPPYALR
jgi:hypothetical protein